MSHRLSSSSPPVPISHRALTLMTTAYLPFAVTYLHKIETPPEHGFNLRRFGKELTTMKIVLNNCMGYVPNLFETPESLWAEVKTFIDFQGNLDYFSLEPGTPYCHTLKLYKDISSPKQYISKNDIFLYLQGKILELEPKLKNNLALTVLSYFLRSEESNLNGTCEFVEFEEDEFQVLDEELARVTKIMKENIRKLAPNDVTAEKMLTKFRRLLPGRPSDTEKLAGVLKNLFEFRELNREQAFEMCTLMYSHLALLIPAIQKIIEERADWFKQEEKKEFTLEVMRENMAATGKRLPAAQKSKPVLRLFTDGDYSFVLAKEIQDYLATFVITEFPKTYLVKIVEFETAKRTLDYYGVEDGDVVFISIPIRRTKHSPVPIPIGNGSFAKLSSDYFFEVFRNLFFGVKAFQADQPLAWNAFEKTLEPLEKQVFIPELKEMYLHDKKFANLVQGKCTGEIYARANRPGKDIREVDENGFTANDLKKELKHLTVDSYFPDVVGNAGVVYEKILKDRNQRALRTPDMYDAVEQCMLLSVLKKWPWMARFLHNQMACHRVLGLVCSKCQEQLKHPKAKEEFLNFYDFNGEVEVEDELLVNQNGFVDAMESSEEQNTAPMQDQGEGNSEEKERSYMARVMTRKNNFFAI